jgi:hypothetical protein
MAGLFECGNSPGPVLVRQAQARYVIDRDEGKAVEHLVLENENSLTDEECEDIRDVLLKAGA